MSRDLFAAFGGPDPEPTKSTHIPAQQSYSFFDDFNNETPSTTTASEPPPQAIQQVFEPSVIFEDNGPANDDDWGDFEDTSGKPKPAAALPVASQFSRWLDEEDDGYMDYEASKAAQPKRPAKWDFTKPDPVPQARDASVLFDADDEPPNEDEDEDDFGDFEDPIDAPIDVSTKSKNDFVLMNALKPVSVTPIAKNATSSNKKVHFDGIDTLMPVSKLPATRSAAVVETAKPSSSLLDLEDLDLDDKSIDAWSKNQPPETKSSPTHGFGTLVTLAPSHTNTFDSIRSQTGSKSKGYNPTPKPEASKTIGTPKKKPESDSDDDWDNFDTWGAEALSEPKPHHRPDVPPPLTSESSTSNLTSPPTNIPPPASILSLFSPLFASAESAFFKPIRQESAQVQQGIYTDPAALAYLKGLLALATVFGRVLAGRKQRWKRDTILAQSMRIGPSAAGGVSGLKLVSIDKAESQKEEREAADALKAWQGQVGKLKSAIAEMKRLTGLEVGKIPELRDVMPLRVAKEIEGGLNGNRPCALCGLKREERVVKVDFEVEDSFGEWWVEDVSMHRGEQIDLGADKSHGINLEYSMSKFLGTA